MPTIEWLTDAELERIKPCQGCAYLGEAGHYGCCNYIFCTGKRRPCPPGKGCTAKNTNDAVIKRRVQPTVSRNKSVDPERQKTDRRRTQIDEYLVRDLIDKQTPIGEMVSIIGTTYKTLVSFIEARGWSYTRAAGGKPVDADTLALFKELYDRGEPYSVIAEQTGRSVRACTAYVQRHGWTRVKKRGRPRKEGADVT